MQRTILLLVLAIGGCRSHVVDGYYESCNLYGVCKSLELSPDSTFALSFRHSVTGELINESGEWSVNANYAVIKYPKSDFIYDRWTGGIDSLGNFETTLVIGFLDTLDHYKITRRGLILFDTIPLVRVADTSWHYSKTKWVKIDTNQVRKTCRKRRRNILAKTNHFWLRIRRELVIQRCWKRPRH